MPKQPMRTMVAQQATDFSRVLNSALAKRVVGKPPYKMAVKAPDVVSTEGGKKARQSVVLEPLQPGEGGSIMCGWLDVANQSAELRTYRAVRTQFKRRFGKALGVNEADYENLCRLLGEMLLGRNIQVVRSDAAPQLQSSAAPAAPGSSVVFSLVLAGAILALAFVAAAFILR